MAKSPKITAFIKKAKAGTSPKKTVNPKLEKMVDALLDEALADPSKSTSPPLTFEQKMAVGALALKLEAVRNKLADDDYGTGFLDDPEPGPAPAGDE
jgi:hypothetical protein